MPTSKHIPHRKSKGVILLFALVFAGIFLTVAVALVSYLLSYGRAEQSTIASAQALAIAEGALDEATYAINQDPSYTGETDTPLGAGTFTITVTNIDSATKSITATAYIPNRTSPTATKTISAHIGINNSIVSFHYGVQAGMGGFSLKNSSSITGNVFSGGTVIGDGGNMIYGDVVSAGPSGVVYGIEATGSVYSHRIGMLNAATTKIDGDAYYTSITNATVSGTSHPNSPDQTVAPLPISDAQIADWETQAAAGGVATCTSGSYTVSSGTVTIGPLKIPCDFNVTNSAHVIIKGHIWVEGDIAVKNQGTISMDPSLGSTNVAIIADNPADQINSSTISVENTATFQDSGTAGSFVFLISQNKSAENGGSVAAFSLVNSASALVAYAAHGLIPISNHVSLKEVTAYRITLDNQANVTYDTGLPSSAFQSGPGGSWTYIPGTYSINK